MYPMKGPAQGGTQVSVRGVMPYSNNSIVLGADKVSHHYYSLGLEHIEAITPLVKFELIKHVTAKDPVGFEFNRAEYDVTYMEPDSISAGATTVQTPPQVLNETDATAEYNVYVSYNRQLWYPLTTSTQRFVFYDYSRMAYGNVIAMSPMRERRLPMFDSSKSRRPTQVLQTATQSMLEGRRSITAVGLGADVAKDISKYFTLMPAYGTLTKEGTPISNCMRWVGG